MCGQNNAFVKRIEFLHLQRVASAFSRGQSDRCMLLIFFCLNFMGFSYSLFTRCWSHERAIVNICLCSENYTFFDSDKLERAPLLLYA